MSAHLSRVVGCTRSQARFLRRTRGKFAIIAALECFLAVVAAREGDATAREAALILVAEVR